MLDLQQQPHRRYNPFTREWVLVSPHRSQRPWQGQTEAVSPDHKLKHDPKCYMCPGNVRACGEHNPAYSGVFVFDNDYPALFPGTPPETFSQGELLLAKGEPGICRVLCFSPRHDLTIAQMPVSDIHTVVEEWKRQYEDLSARPFINYVQIFENRGAMMGCSNPHPHGQIWATATVPTIPNVEQESLLGYQGQHGSCLLCDYNHLEHELGQRLVCENDAFVALVPFWANWPFETMLCSRRHVSDIAALTGDERGALADILKRLTTRYDNLFQTSFPYSMGFHQRPSDGPHPEWHFHAHFYPPLLRSATVKKFLVGYELLAGVQRDITPEMAAAELRKLSDLHYLNSR